MNLQERRRGLKDLVEVVDVLVACIEEHKDKYAQAIEKVIELDNLLSDYNCVDGWDDEDLKVSIRSAILAQGGYDELVRDLDTFNDEMDSHRDDLSEEKQEDFTEKYGGLNDMADNIDSEGYDTLEDFLAFLIDMAKDLRTMRK